MAEAAPVCCRSDSFVLVCACFFLFPRSVQQLLVIWRGEKELGSCGARVKTSERHDEDILHNAASSKNGELEPGILIGNSLKRPWEHKSRAETWICQTQPDVQQTDPWCLHWIHWLDVNNVPNSWSWIIMIPFASWSRRGFVTMLISGDGRGLPRWQHS